MPEGSPVNGDTRMPMFYRGAGRGTYWHANDARLTGFAPQAPGMMASTTRLMDNIARGTVSSPYVSLTRSYGVGLAYAAYSGRQRPTQANPADVYEIELDDPLPAGVQVPYPGVGAAGLTRK